MQTYTKRYKHLRNFLNIWVYFPFSFSTVSFSFRCFLLTCAAPREHKASSVWVEPCKTRFQMEQTHVVTTANLNQPRLPPHPTPKHTHTHSDLTTKSDGFMAHTENMPIPSMLGTETIPLINKTNTVRLSGANMSLCVSHLRPRCLLHKQDGMAGKQRRRNAGRWKNTAPALWPRTPLPVSLYFFHSRVQTFTL